MLPLIQDLYRTHDVSTKHIPLSSKSGSILIHCGRFKTMNVSYEKLSEHRIMFDQFIQMIQQFLSLKDERNEFKEDIEYHKCWKSDIEYRMDQIVMDLKEIRYLDVSYLIDQIMVALNKAQQIQFIKNSFFCDDIDQIRKDRLKLDSELNFVNGKLNVLLSPKRGWMRYSRPGTVSKSTKDKIRMISDEIIQDKEIMAFQCKLLCSGFIRNQSKNVSKSIPVSVELTIFKFYKQSFYQRINDLFREKIGFFLLYSMDENFLKIVKGTIAKYRNIINLHDAPKVATDYDLNEWFDEMWMEDINKNITNLFIKLGDLWSTQYLLDQISMKQYLMRMEYYSQESILYNFVRKNFNQHLVASFTNAILTRHKYGNYRTLITKLCEDKLKFIYKLVKKVNEKEAKRLKKAFLNQQRHSAEQ